MIGEKFSETRIDDLVRAEKLEILFHHSYPGVIFSVLTAILLVAALWSVQSHVLLLTWAAAVFLTAAIRMGYFVRYRLQKRSPEQLLGWEKPYFCVLIISALIWGLGAVIVVPEDSQFHQAVVVCFLMGLVAGAVSAYSIDRRLTLWVVVVLMFPIAIWLFLQNTAETMPMAAAGLLFFGWLIKSTRVHSETLHRNLVLKHELQRSTDRAEYLARTDVLTGLYNRRAFYEQLVSLGDYSQRHKESLAVIMMDLDHFKDINDSYGHSAGDGVLETVGTIFRSITRTSDICTRLGGEEFGVLIRKCNLQDAQVLAEKLRKEIASTEFEAEGKAYSVTASFGVASGTADAVETLKRADQAMYRAKEQGRNRVVSPVEG